MKIKKESKRCVWEFDNFYGGWDTSCNFTFDLNIEGELADNSIKYCPFCGRLIYEKP